MESANDPENGIAAETAAEYRRWPSLKVGRPLPKGGQKLVVSSHFRRTHSAPPSMTCSVLCAPFASGGLRVRGSPWLGDLRIAVRPMCRYSAVDGVPNAWHLARYPASRSAMVDGADAAETIVAQELGVENPAWATLPAPYAHWLARYRGPGRASAQ